LKTYVLPRKLLSEIDEVLAQRPNPRRSPLQAVVDLLHEGRNYFFTGAFLRAEDLTQEQTFARQQRERHHHVANIEVTKKSEFAAPIKIGVHVLGLLKVESGRPDGISSQDRVLIEAVAERLARFLSTDGRYLLRRLRESVRAENAKSAKA
jgi:hypothetical protein